MTPPADAPDLEPVREELDELRRRVDAAPEPLPSDELVALMEAIEGAWGKVDGFDPAVPPAEYVELWETVRAKPIVLPDGLVVEPGGAVATSTAR